MQERLMAQMTTQQQDMQSVSERVERLENDLRKQTELVDQFKVHSCTAALPPLLPLLSHFVHTLHQSMVVSCVVVCWTRTRVIDL